MYCVREVGLVVVASVLHFSIFHFPGAAIGGVIVFSA